MSADFPKPIELFDRLSLSGADEPSPVALLQAVVESTAAGIVVLDLSQRVIAVNRYYLEMWGLPPEWGQIADPLERLPMLAEQTLDPQAFLVRSRQLTEQTELIAHDLIALKDGRYIDRTAQPYRLDGEIAGQLFTYFDVTEREQARLEAEAATRAKSIFLASMSHEIRTPMSGVVGMTSLLAETSLTGEQSEFIDIIRSSGETLLTIINNILDFSRIEAGKFELENLPFDLRGCIEESLDVLAAMASEKHIELAYFMEPSVPEVIVGDATRLRQILINLLQNAVKFTEQGEVVIEVGRIPSPELEEQSSGAFGGPNCQLIFSVRDTGIGIAADRIERLFQPYAQADVSIGARYGGSGLGLVISKQLSGLMGGGMWAESEGIPGRGSTFHFTILAEAGLESRGTPLYFEQRHLKGKRILILTANPANRLILSHYCEVWGALPRLAESERELLNWIYRGEVADVVLMDVDPREMDRLLVANHVHQHRPDLPMVAMAPLKPRRRALAHDLFAARLNKPIKLAQLYDTLTAVLTRQAALLVKRPPTRYALDGQMCQKTPARVLVAEDDAVNQRVIQLMLSRLGYHADLTANGAEALRLIQTGCYDVVFMDVFMPEMDGVEVVRRVRAENPSETQPYIIALTADALEGRRDYYLNQGMDDYLAKPFHIEHLCKAMQHYGALRELGSAAKAMIPAPPPPQDDKAIQMEIVEGWITAIGSAPTYLATVDAFLRDSPRLLEEMLQALRYKDWRALRGLSHALKSSSGSMGAVRLFGMLETLELASIRLLADQDQADCHQEPLAGQIKIEYQNVCVELLTLQSRLSGALL